MAGGVAIPLLVMCAAVSAAAQQTKPETLIQAGHWKQARAIVESHLHESPDDPLAIFLLSQIRHAFGEDTTPLRLAERAVALNGRVAKFHRQLAEVLAARLFLSPSLSRLRWLLSIGRKPPSMQSRGPVVFFFRAVRGSPENISGLGSHREIKAPRIDILKTRPDIHDIRCEEATAMGNQLGDRALVLGGSIAGMLAMPCR